MIADHHFAMLAASGITREHAELRGYRTVDDPRRLAELGITKAGRNVPGLLLPQLRCDGSTWGHQYRPDTPRLRDGKPVKYETPWHQCNGIDVPPGVGPMLGDPSMPLWITEGLKKADCGALHGLCIIALPGVWSWRGKNARGGKTAVPEWHDIALNGRRVILAFDGDVARKPSVRKALCALAGYLEGKGARVEYLHLPDTEDKTGLDDYLMSHTVEDLWRLVKPMSPPAEPADDTRSDQQPSPEPEPEPVHPVSLADAHAVFRHWFGEDYDTDALDAECAAVAVERFDDGSDPIWLLLISGPGNAKTETVQALDGTGAVVSSSISSDAALLSATPQGDRAKNATGGLLRKIGDRGVLIIKDVTSILSMDRNIRGKCLPRCVRSTTVAGPATSAPTADARSHGQGVSPSVVSGIRCK